MKYSSHRGKPGVKLLSGLVAGLFAASVSLSVEASDADRIKELEGKLEKSINTIDALLNRVAQLEASSSKPKAAAPAEERVAALEQSVSSLSESLSKRSSDTGLPIHGFLDVSGAKQSSVKNSDYPAAMRKGNLLGFNGGTLDFYLTPQFGNRIKTLVELAFEYDDAGSLASDLERAQIGYTFGDNNTLWLGRFHTPYGYWNTGFHHGAQLQTAVSRPRFLDFEDKGGLLPAHSVGLWFNGKLPAGDGKVAYDLYLANGNRVMAAGNDKVINLNGFTDDNARKLLGFNLGYEWKNGLKLGLHGFNDLVNTYDGDSAATNAILAKTKVGMLGGYAFYDNNDWELLGEYYHWNNNTSELDASMVAANVGTQGKHGSSAWFVQAGYNLNAQWMPYTRYEKVSLNKEDPFFNSLNSGRSYNRLSLGLRHNLDPRAALKFEFSHTNEKAGKQVDTSTAGAPALDTFGSSKYNMIQAQYAIGF